MPGGLPAARGGGGGRILKRRKCLREPCFQSFEQLACTSHIVTLERGACVLQGTFRLGDDLS